MNPDSLQKVTMDKAKLICTSSDQQGDQEVTSRREPFSDLYKQTVQQLSSRLSETSMKVMQEELQVLQRSSYYLKISRDLVATSGEPISRSPDERTWSDINEQRLRVAATQAETQVKLILTSLEQIYREIVSGCRELEAFVGQYDQGLVDSDTAASVKQTLDQTLQYISDFGTGMTCYLGPLTLKNHLIPFNGNFPRPQLSVSIVIKKPVVFDRTASHSSSNSAYLCWEVADEQSRDPKEQFEIQVRSLHPAANDQDQLCAFQCQSYNMKVKNLVSDRSYEFSVKRRHTSTLVYGTWTDTIILKTLGASE